MQFNWKTESTNQLKLAITDLSIATPSTGCFFFFNSKLVGLRIHKFLLKIASWYYIWRDSEEDKGSRVHFPAAMFAFVNLKLIKTTVQHHMYLAVFVFLTLFKMNWIIKWNNKSFICLIIRYFGKLGWPLFIMCIHRVGSFFIWPTVAGTSPVVDALVSRHITATNTRKTTTYLISRCASRRAG